MQKIIFNTGFELLYWNTEHSPPKYLNDLTPEIINRCLKNNDFLLLLFPKKSKHQF